MLKTFDIRGSLCKTVHLGAALVKNVLSASALVALQAEVVKVPFDLLVDDGEKVQQRFERAAYLGVPDGFPCIQELQLETRHIMQSAGDKYPVLDNWEPIDTVIQRYADSGYLTSHLDLLRHRGVIAIFTLLGSCLFEVLSDRRGPVMAQFVPEPGDLVLLRAPGLSGSTGDDRPFHRVTGNISADPFRVSVTFRNNTEPEKSINGLHYSDKERPWTPSS